MNKERFLLRESQGINFYACRAFECIPHIRHGFSTRRGPGPEAEVNFFNLGNSSRHVPARVNEIRRRLLSALDLEDASLITLRQVHSNRVHIIEDNAAQWNPSEGDALVTRVENTALAVQVADCLPILIADPANNAVGAVHSGWRGTLLRVLPQTIEVMKKAFNSNPADLRIAVGPGIRACCFEVGHEVAELFNNEYPGCSEATDRPGKSMLDLVKVLHTQMDHAGVLPAHRYDLGACTRCNPDEFFSYRAEGPATGRMMAVIALIYPKAQ